MNLIDHLRIQARVQPTAIAAIDATGTWSREALWSRVQRIAELLQHLDVRRVASRLDNSVEAVAVDLALRLIGAVHLPLPPFFTEAQVQHAQSMVGADVCISPRREARAIDLGAGLYLHPLQVPEAMPVMPSATALVTFTSGSTGAPKGVCLAAEHLDAVAMAVVDALVGQIPQRHLSLMPLAVLLEQVAGVYAALYVGAPIVLPGLAETGLIGAAQLDAGRLCACIDRHRPQSLILVPQMLQAWVAALAQGGSAPDSLRFCAVGGARVSGRLLDAAAGLPVFQGYGLSECGSVVSLNRPGANCPGSVGQALRHVRLEVDADGEILIGGSQFLGYVGEQGERPPIYRSGDLGHVDEQGYVWLDGRRRNVFITAFGRNVSPEWVESELMQHPDIAQAVVDGEAREFNSAVVVPRRPDLSEVALDLAIAEVNRGLPDYARVSRYLRADEPFLPGNQQLTGNGRVRRDVVLARYAEALEVFHTQTQ
ncbi:MAG: AMP-binding protein [Xanthomonadales bacterium]|nr:AMP-binding protein [Xanthomonadales bacterium]MCP5476884.1 AMP-binding protein [Rhodanobacteraceae bacterium]